VSRTVPGFPVLAALVLTLVGAALATMIVTWPEVIPWTSFIPLVVFAGLFLPPRWFAVVLMVTASLLAYAGWFLNGEKPVFRGSVAVTVLVAAMITWSSLSRARLGVQATLAESMLLDLRDRIRGHAGLPTLPEPWHAEVDVESAYGEPFSGDFAVAVRSNGGQRLEVALVDVSGKGLDAGTRALLLSGAFGSLLGEMDPTGFLAAANSFLLRQEWDEGFATAIHMALELDIEPVEAMRANFQALHRQRFGYVEEDAEPVVDALVVEAVGKNSSSSLLREGDRSAQPSGGGVGEVKEGPAMIFDATSTTVVEPGWSAARADDGTLILTRTTPATRAHAIGTETDPVRLEIFNNLFMAIAEEMGVALQSTATSVNIKERLDFSCALFDAAGALIANAPHIPVHLGSMGESIRTIIESRGIDGRGDARDGRGIRRGDAYVLNDPYRGGTHLPDITVIAPVFYADTDKAPSAFVAARGHHADIGGISPGSMPPDSQTIEEEGVLIDNELLVDEGHFRETEMRALLGSGEWPARNPDRNISDLKAQLAACTRGAEGLLQTASDYGPDVVAAYMGHVLANAEESVRRLLGRLDDGEFDYEMDNGAHVRVRITVDKVDRSATFDFTGTSNQLPDNFNAPFSIVRAASLYVVRTLIDDAIPMNDGCLRPITLIVPEGSMLNPKYPAAVVAGNVETSQVVTDALFAATGRLAPSQGTMNNFTFGNARHQYYETIAGGSGAGPDHDGTSAVQTHMTNSRLTDPEILETRLPVRLDAFAIRRGSGGEGAHHGGDGIVRRVTFLEPMRANILANRRRVLPRGIAGGADAQAGRNWVERTDGSVEMLSATAYAEMQPGDRFVIETPGGGGFGRRAE